MANSDHRGNDDPERTCCGRSDAARKRAALRYTCWGWPTPPSLRRRETEEYDRARPPLLRKWQLLRGLELTLLPRPVKRELEELPSVKMEP
ncbi:hypothetical protein D1007_05205 [Hordeum vulgare]|nr:hypothetical protein D1007_05205 [Hordeum vulgare]